MIRLATQDDFEEIIEISKLFYDEICLDEVGYRFDDSQIRESYAKGIDKKDHFVLLYIEDGKILGLFFFSIKDEHYYFVNKRFAAEIVWHSVPTLPRLKRLKVMIELFEAGEMFMRSRGVESIYCGLDARKDFYHPGINRYLKKKGYSSIVTTFHKEIS